MGWADKMRGKVEAAITGGAPVVRDQLGRVLEIGDGVVVLQPVGEFRVAAIDPVIPTHPGMPPNLMKVRLVSIAELVLPRDAALESVYRTRTVLEITGKQPAAGGPTAVPPPPSGAERTAADIARLRQLREQVADRQGLSPDEQQELGELERAYGDISADTAPEPPEAV